MPAEGRPALPNALTFDVEDWFHGLEIDRSHWPGLERRLVIGLRAILDALARAGARATFFVLGCVAHEQPRLVEEIARAGHEVGTHGWAHTPLYRQTRAEFRAELRASLGILQELTQRPVVAHRAAFFSVTRRTAWAFDELERAGVRYDSSVFPVHNYRYGIPSARRFPHPVNDGALLEFPISTLRCGGVNLPFSGGFYARLLPYPWVKWGIRRLNAQGQPALIYFHPWELDPAHPRIGRESRPLARATHYHALATTRRKLEALLADFRWAPISDVLSAWAA